MTSIRSLSIIATAIFVLSVSCYASQDDVFEEYVQSFVAQLARSGLELPAFDGAVLDCVETVELWEEAKGTLCWLKNEKGRCGYVLFSGEPELPSLLAFSATTSAPSYFSELAPSDKKAVGALRRVTGFSFVTGVPLISSQNVRLGTKEIQLTEGACSLAAVMNYLQHVKAMPLFGHIGYFISPEYVSQAPAKLSPADAQKLAEDYAKTMQKAQESGWKPFAQELSEVLEKEDVRPSAAKTAEDRAAMMEKAHALARPIRRKRLLNPLVPQERFDLLLSENTELERLASPDTSQGMRDALLLQEDYLSSDLDKLDQDVLGFLATRGLKSDVKKSDFSDAPRSLLPCVMYSGAKSAGVILGYLDIDSVEFAFVFFPSTSTPAKTPLSAKLRPADDQQATSVPAGVPAEYADEAAVALKRWKTMVDKTIVVEDDISSFPKAVECGVHLVKCSALAQWQALSIGTLTPADNWGAVPLEERKDAQK